VERTDLLPAMAADLVGRKLDLIVAITDPMALAAKNASSTIPVVSSSAETPSPMALPPVWLDRAAT